METYYGLEKLAVGLKDIRKISLINKASIIKRPLALKSAFNAQSVILSKKPSIKKASGFVDAIKKIFASPLPMTAAYVPHISDLNIPKSLGVIERFLTKRSIKQMKKTDPRIFGKIFTPKGEAVNIIKKQSPSLYKKLSNNDKEIINRISVIHEGLEMKTVPTKNLLSHISPDVIFKESNIVGSLSSKHKNVKKYFKEMRQSEQRVINNLGIDFEYGSKVNRRRRKFLLDQYNKKA